MPRKIIALPLAVIIAGTLFGCTPAAETPPPIAASSTTTPAQEAKPTASAAPSEASNPEDFAKNLGTLSQKATAAMSDANFREALAGFLESGKKPEGFDSQFKAVFDLVAKDGDWEKGKASYVKAAERNSEIITGGDEIDLYLSAMVVSNVFPPELLKSAQNPQFEIDPTFLKRSDDGLLTWTQTAGVRVVDKGGVIHVLYSPRNDQFFTKSGSNVSAKGILENMMRQNDEIEPATMNMLLSAVQSWIEKNSEKVEESTDLSPFMEEIFGSVELPHNAKLGISGSVGKYVISLEEGGANASIDSSGKSSFGNVSTTYELTPSKLSEAWDIYETMYLVAVSETGESPDLASVIQAVRESGEPKGAKWKIGKSGNGKHVILEISNREYKLYDITATV